LKGWTLIELLVVLAVIALALLVAVPGWSALSSTARTGAAAREMAMRLAATRWKSVSAGVAHGLWFRRDAQGWGWYEVRDGNENGLRTAELLDGTDLVLSGPHRLEQSVPGVRLGIPPLGAIPRIPPATGSLVNLADPVQFGRSDIVAFSPLGRASSGTLYVTDGGDGLFGVLLYGPTSRVRVWRYARRTREWTL